MLVYLSDNLTMNEMIDTRSRLSNRPPKELEQKLFFTAQLLFQPIRDVFGKILVTSGYRSPEVNADVGGAEDSQHMDGEAVDLKPLETDVEVVFQWCIKNMIFGQCILEDKKIIHISMPRMHKINNHVLIRTEGAYTSLPNNEG